MHQHFGELMWRYHEGLMASVMVRNAQTAGFRFGIWLWLGFALAAASVSGVGAGRLGRSTPFACCWGSGIRVRVRQGRGRVGSSFVEWNEVGIG